MMRIVKVFNNSVVLARDDAGQAIVLLGAGLGFRTRPGARVNEDLITFRFVPGSGNDVGRLSAFIAAIPPEYLVFATEMAEVAENHLGVPLAQSVVIPLADHLAFAVKQYRDGKPVEYALTGEVRYLYPRELEAAEAALDVLRSRIAVPIPPEEAVPVALHIISATAGLDIPKTFEMTRLLEELFVKIEKHYNTRIDRQGVDAARFVTHIRYLLARVRQPSRAQPMPDGLRQTIEHAYGRAHNCATRLADAIGDALDTEVTPNEVVYLTLHVARLTGEE